MIIKIVRGSRLHGDDITKGKVYALTLPDAGAQLPRRLAARSSGVSKFVPPLAIKLEIHDLAAILESSYT